MQFIKYLKDIRTDHFLFLILMIVLNVACLKYSVYAFNLLSVFVMSYWFIIMKAEKDIYFKKYSK